MGIFSGNPADRATGNVSPGSRAEAGRPTSSSGMSNGTTRNSSIGGSGGGGGGGGNAGLARDLGDRGFRATSAGVGAGSMKDQSRISPISTTKDQSRISTSGSLKDQSRITSSMSTGPVSRNIQTQSVAKPNGVVSTPAPAFKSGLTDSKSIVPGSVTMKAETISFGKKNPSMAKYLGGTTAKPVNVSVSTAKKMATNVPKVGAYISGAGSLAKSNLPKESLTQLGVTKKGYGSTVLNVGGVTSVTLSYPKSTATGKSYGTYKAGPLSSTGPVPRNTPKPSTGPVSRGIQGSTVKSTSSVRDDRAPSTPAKSTSRYYDVDYKRDTTEAFRKSAPAKVSAPKKTTSTKTASTKTKSTKPASYKKDGYTYTKGNDGKYTNFRSKKLLTQSKGRNK